MLYKRLFKDQLTPIFNALECNGLSSAYRTRLFARLEFRVEQRIRSKLKVFVSFIHFGGFLPLDEAVASRAVFVTVSRRVETLLEPAK